MVGRRDEDRWIEYELAGYPVEVEVPGYRKSHVTFLDTYNSAIEVKGDIRIQPLRTPASTMISGMSSGHGVYFTVSDSLANRVYKLASQRPTGMKFTPWTLNQITSQLTNHVLDYIDKRILELEYSGIPASIFEERRVTVDEKLVDISLDATKKLQAAYELLAKGRTDENWSQVALECRRLMKDVADVLFPPRKEPHVDKSGVEREVGSEQFINRLLAFVDQKTEGSTRRMVMAKTEHLGSLLDKVQELASGGIHSKVTKAEAKTCVIYTYLLLGDIIGLAQADAPAQAQ
jgi:hypothetical protein